MDDARVWAFEESLWKADAAQYRAAIDDACLMVVPQPPFVLGGAEAVAAVTETPRWTEVAFSEARVSRPEEGMIVVASSTRRRRMPSPIRRIAPPPIGDGAMRTGAWCSISRRRGWRWGRVFGPVTVRAELVEAWSFLSGCCRRQRTALRQAQRERRGFDC